MVKTVSSQPIKSKLEPILGLIGTFVGLVVFTTLLFNQPQLQFKYLPDQLSTNLENGKPSGFFEPQNDPKGNRYSWTTGRPTILFNFESLKPLKLTFEIRSGAITGGSSGTVQVLANGVEVGQLQPDPQNFEFQTFSLNFTPPKLKEIDAPQLKIELVTATFRPGPNDNRALGIMVKSITLDKSEAWSNMGKWLWLLCLLPLLAILAFFMRWVAYKTNSALAGYLAVLTCLVGMVSSILPALILLKRVGVLDNSVYLVWIFGGYTLALLFGGATLVLPWGRSGNPNLYHLVLQWIFVKQWPNSKIRPLVLWLFVLALGSLLLYGRYSWDAYNSPFSSKSYPSSLYFFWVILPISYYLTLILSKKRNLAVVVTVITFIITSLPYQLLGLHKFRYVLNLSPEQKAPNLIWFPGAFNDEAFPNDKLFMLGLLLAFTIIAFWLGRDNKVFSLTNPQIRVTLKRISPFVGIFFLILLQTWLHSGLRSPYTYTSHYEKPPEENYWYNTYLLENQKGAVNADVSYFISLDRYFNGYPEPVQTLIMRRSFIHYVSSHLSYFWNPYYVYLIINSLIWFIAVVCTYHYIKRVLNNLQIARYAAALVMCGSGFIYFVAQPMSYFAAYAVIIVSLFLFEEIMVERRSRWSSLVLFGVLFGLCSCIYDLFPLYPMLLLYSFFRQVKFWHTLLSIVISMVLYGGFMFLQFVILGLVEVSANLIYGTKSVENIIRLILNFEFGRLYNLTAEFIKIYAQNLSYSFLIVGLLLALIGLFVAENQQQKLLLVLLFLPSFLLNAVLQYGGVVWVGTPFVEIARLSYIAYPAIYLAAALALYRISTTLQNTRFARVTPYLPWLAISLIFVWNNMDVFGFPSPYYHFYWPLQHPWLSKI